ncbi:unnamed protein product, partial [Prorocentrum cordatum]
FQAQKVLTKVKDPKVVDVAKAGLGVAEAAASGEDLAVVELQLLMGQLKDDFPERAAVASSIAASASAIRSQQSEARPLRQQASEAQQALDKNVRALNSLDSQIADTESRLAELKEKRAETATQQVQLKARYLELAAKVADLPPPPQAELQGHLSNFDSVLESGDLAAIREGWAKLKTSCQSVAQKEAA